MKPSPDVEREYLDELIAKEREIAKEEEKKKAATKAANGRIGKLEQRRDELLDLLEGREHIQPELPMRKNGATKPAPAALKWTAEGSNDVASIDGGAYCVEPSLSPTAPAFTIFWTPNGGKSKRVGVAEDMKLAREVAEVDRLERGADAILENAGHGALTKKGRARP